MIGEVKRGRIKSEERFNYNFGVIITAHGREMGGERKWWFWEDEGGRKEGMETISILFG